MAGFEGWSAIIDKPASTERDDPCNGFAWSSEAAVVDEPEEGGSLRRGQGGREGGREGGVDVDEHEEVTAEDTKVTAARTVAGFEGWSGIIDKAASTERDDPCNGFAWSSEAAVVDEHEERGSVRRGQEGRDGGTEGGVGVRLME